MKLLEQMLVKWMQREASERGSAWMYFEFRRIQLSRKVCTNCIAFVGGMRTGSVLRTFYRFQSLYCVLRITVSAGAAAAAAVAAAAAADIGPLCS